MQCAGDRSYCGCAYEYWQSPAAPGATAARGRHDSQMLLTCLITRIHFVEGHACRRRSHVLLPLCVRALPDTSLPFRLTERWASSSSVPWGLTYAHGRPDG
jgi:hypothetical protein